MTRPDHPGRLTLGFGGQHICVDVNPNDPHALIVSVKHTANLDRTLLRSHHRVFAHIAQVQDASPNAPRLWIGHCVIELEPQHVERAQTWCQRYAAWAREGDIGARGAQQAAA